MKINVFLKLPIMINHFHNLSHLCAWNFNDKTQTYLAQTYLMTYHNETQFCSELADDFTI